MCPHGTIVVANFHPGFADSDRTERWPHAPTTPGTPARGGGRRLVLAACATTVTGKPVSVYDDPFKVGGLQASDGPTGLRRTPNRRPGR